MPRIPDDVTLEELAQEMRKRLKPEEVEQADSVVKVAELVNAVHELSVAVQDQTETQKQSAEEIRSQLKFIGDQLAHLYERHFDSVT